MSVPAYPHDVNLLSLCPCSPSRTKALTPAAVAHPPSALPLPSQQLLSHSQPQPCPRPRFLHTEPGFFLPGTPTPRTLLPLSLLSQPLKLVPLKPCTHPSWVWP